MLFNKDSAIQKCSKDSALFASQEKLVPCQPSGRSSVHSSSRLDDMPYRPDNVDFRPDPPLYREASVPACIRPDDLAARPDDSQ
jgi:hypothetical protein